MLQTIDRAAEAIAAGRPLLLAGDEAALRRLPRGNWIAGTIPYFMDREGGVCSRERVFVTEVCQTSGVQIRSYDVQALPRILQDAPDNGFSALIMPAGSPVHTTYARDAGDYEGIFVKPVVGWIAGVHVTEIGQRLPQVVNGVTGEWCSGEAVVMHVTLPAGKIVELDIVNVFEPGMGESICFLETGFEARECLAGGKRVSLAEYLRSVGADTRLPLTADYHGTVVNVSIQSVDDGLDAVRFYAPVFPGIEYKLASPVPDYVASFEHVLPSNGEPLFACNCILNYLYSELEGKKTGAVTGPITFGEIAHLLLNQTMVRLFVREG
ncbi:MAG: hypothetical protein HY820_15425 [Acidobacteria bacterium]|nr:hypothetical protein [Acidobacteriota bacterium]